MTVCGGLAGTWGGRMLLSCSGWSVVSIEMITMRMWTAILG